MTMFDISTLHATGEHKRQNGQQQQREEEEEGTIVEVDYYHSSPLIVMNDDAILQKVKDDLDSILGTSSRESQIVDAAIIRLPNAVNWYFPGSYASMPDTRSSSISNAYFAGDLVKTRHGSWSQEKAFVTGIECANMILGKRKDAGIISLEKEEFHVGLGRKAVTIFKELMGGNSGALPLLADFLR